MTAKAPAGIDLDALFGERGPLARAVPGFRRREQQVEFARPLSSATSTGTPRAARTRGRSR